MLIGNILQHRCVESILKTNILTDTVSCNADVIHKYIIITNMKNKLCSIYCLELMLHFEGDDDDYDNDYDNSFVITSRISQKRFFLSFSANCPEIHIYDTETAYINSTWPSPHLASAIHSFAFLIPDL